MEELDDLLGQLDSHKVPTGSEPQKPLRAQVHRAEPSGFKAPPLPPVRQSNDEIDNIIANMDFDPNTPDSAAICAHCKRSILVTVEFVQIGNHKYHIDHWSCSKCGRALRGDEYFETRAGLHECENCYKSGLNTCHGCHKHIEGGHQFAEAEGKYFHTGCFICSVCRVPLVEYHERGGKTYCNDHFAQEFNPKCHGCSNALDGKYAQDAEGRKWHNGCFKCQHCGKLIGAGKYHEKNGRVHCMDCK